MLEGIEEIFEILTAAGSFVDEGLDVALCGGEKGHPSEAGELAVELGSLEPNGVDFVQLDRLLRRFINYEIRHNV